ncbi:putative drug resistance transporter [Sphingobium sp. SYK-6]|uniref:multidrug effflux MFS transporter n=1 Tax=Sphingobium sp. (strain NBRC 103272 / SYK-6) TaxID=627192 RepID=UPI0002276746|nr:multidrug effflux MFS transporter [Sphingobium sp. SYK-6]BAK65153.1 putative drug resistance transporter [Sphingobium sp. SYK-6]
MAHRTDSGSRRDATSAGPEKLPLGQIILLAALTAVLPASIDGLSPALPAIAAALYTRAAHVPAAISAFVISFAIAQLLGGMLADALGRRPVVLAGLAIYVLASVLALFATSFPLLLAARALQGLGAAAAVLLARTIVRDQLPREAAGRALAQIGIFFSCTPIIAPLISGVLVSVGGWRAPLLAMAVLGVVIGAASLLRLPETLARDKRLPFDGPGLLGSFARLSRSPALLAYVLANAFAYSGILLFSAAAPQVMIDHMGLGALDYALLFALSTMGFMAGNAASFRLVRRRGVDGTLRIGVPFQLAGPIAMLVATQLWPEAWAALIVPQILYTFGWGIVQPQAQAGALSTHPESIGQASALLGFVQLAIAAVIVAVFSRLTGGTSLALALGMAFCGAGALLCGWLMVGRR